MDSNLQIGISGPQCSGKTTLIKEILNDKYLISNYKVIPEIVRSIKLRMGKDFKFNEIGDFSSQKIILEEHHRNIVKHPKLITDRCALDAFVYATVNYCDGKFSYREWAHFEKIFLATIHKYDYIFYLPPVIPLEDDGVRSLDIEFRERVHKMFMQIATQYVVNLTPMNSLDGRLDQVKLFARNPTVPF